MADHCAPVGNRSPIDDVQGSGTASTYAAVIKAKPKIRARNRKPARIEHPCYEFSQLGFISVEQWVIFNNFKVAYF